MRTRIQAPSGRRGPRNDWCFVEPAYCDRFGGPDLASEKGGPEPPNLGRGKEDGDSASVVSLMDGNGKKRTVMQIVDRAEESFTSPHAVTQLFDARAPTLSQGLDHRFRTLLAELSPRPQGRFRLVRTLFHPVTGRPSERNIR